MKNSLIKSAVLTLPILFITGFLLSGGRLPSGLESRISFSIVYLFLNSCFFMMVRTGRTDRWRALVFIALSFSFLLTFAIRMLEARGTLAMTDNVILSGATPFCHLVIPQTLIPLALSRTIIFPGTIMGDYTSIAGMLVFWLLLSAALGRGWCGWVCPFGGLDDLFSRLRKAPAAITINARWTDVSTAVLIAVVLFSATSLAPVYCVWLCPYKSVTEFLEVKDLSLLIQLIISAVLFIGLVVVLPFLTKKRTQCGILCPFGAFQSLANHINPFEIKVETAKCLDCGLCVKACPVFAMTEESRALGDARLNCIKCGKCVDVCPSGAVYHHIKLTESGPSAAQRLMFLYPAFIFISIFGGGMMLAAVGRIFRFLTTGSFI